MAPRALAGPPHSLPPMLHKWCRRAMSGCSKGARGLFVLSRVLGILTETPISPSLWRRQRPSRYAIRAGRNLPDKEFRYLRTVIVTAAVYRGFDSELWDCSLTPPLNLPAPGRRQCLYVVLLDFADTCVFAKQSLGPILCGPLPLMPAKGTQVPRAPLLPKLRGHFAEFLLHSSLEHLRLLASPTCVRLRYGHKMHSPPRLFSAAGFTRLALHEGELGVRSRLPGSFIPRDRLPPCTGTTAARPWLHSCVPPAGGNAHPVVREYSPASHRLRPSASA
jgi:hypothetical protein